MLGFRTSVMSTKKLAKQLGLLRQRSQTTGLKKSLVSNQIFSYLIVIDFESTCWREKNNYSQEIIEFPAVLLNTSTGEVESEFHTYVQPQEHPVLSEFCTELTGITQMQVEAGIPLQICLSQFRRWLQKLQLQMGVVFPNKEQRCLAPSPSQKLCTFLTWSDWDLGVCLQYECKRKQIHKPDVVNSWIDLRSTYRLFYSRKPKGLNGALQDLGIQFSGREHSGLDDARNTARLAMRMMRDGCVMKITRSLERMPSMVRPTSGNTNPPNKTKICNAIKDGNAVTTNKLSSSKSQLKSVKSSSGRSRESVSPTYQSLVSPKTLLNGVTTPACDGSSSMRSVTAEVVTNVSAAVVTICPSAQNHSLVLCSTIVSHLPQQSHTSKAGTAGFVQAAELSVETKDRCGSYDDVVLEVEDVCAERDGTFEHVSDVDSGCYVGEEDVESHLPADEVMIRDNEAEMGRNGIETGILETKNSATRKVPVSHHHHHLISRQETCFAVPKAVTWKSNRQKTGVKILQLQEQTDVPDEIIKLETPFSLRQEMLIPERTSTPNTSFFRPKPAVTQHTKHKKTPGSSVTIYTDSIKSPATASRPSSCGPHANVLSSLSPNTPFLSANHSSNPRPVKGGKITSPLCACGRRAKRLVVSNGGPNQGRGFYCCTVRRSGSGSRIQKGCEFFKWESALIKSSVPSPTARSSVSMHQMNSTLSWCPPQRSLRKSY